MSPQTQVQNIQSISAKDFLNEIKKILPHDAKIKVFEDFGLPWAFYVFARNIKEVLEKIEEISRKYSGFSAVLESTNDRDYAYFKIIYTLGGRILW